MTMLPRSTSAPSSPARALSERSQWERAFVQVTDRHVMDYLSVVTDTAMQLNRVEPSVVAQLYSETVDSIITDLGLSAGAADIVRTQYLDSPLSSEVYETAAYLLESSRSQQLTDTQRRDLLSEGLSYETATIVQDPALVASSAPRIIGNLLARAHSRGKRWRAAAREDARTASSGAYNETQIRRIQADSKLTHKRWVTRRDQRVRHSHHRADGQTIPKASLFQVGAARLLYPGQGTFPYDEIANCRCIVVGVPAADVRK